MDILIVSATPFEIYPLLAHLGADFQKDEQEEALYVKDGLRIRILVTGVGQAATAWALGQFLARQRPDLLINAGVAGAIDPALPLGGVVHVVSEQWGDLGVEEADGAFTDMFALGLIEKNGGAYVNGVMYNPAAHEAAFLPKAKGVTVNKVHGYAPSIEALRSDFPQAQIETMEGAAVFYACIETGVPFMQIRAVSNYVEPRNREAWQLSLAIENLNKVLLDLIAQLEATLVSQ